MGVKAPRIKILVCIPSPHFIQVLLIQSGLSSIIVKVFSYFGMELIFALSLCKIYPETEVRMKINPQGKALILAASR